MYVKLMPEAAHLFAQIFDGFGFTIFALKSMVAILSPTAKNLYRLFGTVSMYMGGMLHVRQHGKKKSGHLINLLTSCVKKGIV